MSRSYAVSGGLTTPNSATLPILNILSPGSVRPRIYEIFLGSSSAPANHSGKFNVTRCSTAGTPASNPTPAPIDPGDPAALCTVGLATFSSTPPTLGPVLLQWSMNQQATIRWQAREGKELVGPATSNNGMAFMNPTVDSTFTTDFTIAFEE